MDQSLTLKNQNQNFKNYFSNQKKVVVREQDYALLQLIVHTTQLKMQGKNVVIQSKDGRQYAV